MAGKKTQALIKRDIYENWSKATNYIPMSGIIIVVDMPDGSIQLKLGDGQTLVQQLPNLLENNTQNKQNASNVPSYSNEILEF